MSPWPGRMFPTKVEASMRFSLLLGVVGSLAAGLLVSPAWAGPQRAGGKAVGKDPARMQRLLEKFDTDQDGKLSESERQAARAAHAAKAQAAKGQGVKAPGAKGQAGGRRPDPEKMKKLVARFDKDGDGKLNDSERQAAREALRKKKGKKS
ncbi:MAG: EF-hand domain-containing protein [Planctomycetes bacterium]|nr:EF-hand domain-containing protein [Planctomycetota bacterium]